MAHSNIRRAIQNANLQASESIKAIASVNNLI
jgi:hypothetical protein